MLYNKGVIYQQQEKLKPAINNYTQAIAINPHYASAYENRGFAYRQKGNKNKAIENLKKAMSLYQEQGKTKKYQKMQEILNQLR
ncbi:MAG: hypothetical protein BRC33_06505 [Cyanobacteria bacterium SW_9_44_58]|nr:MAG: hypothetical protein BRC33_06505 [Cyanobacteria bacterium SW_9_44_58]